MSKLRYKEGGVWKSIAPSQKEFDDLKSSTTALLADIALNIKSFGAVGTADDTQTFKAAFAYAFQNNFKLRIPKLSVPYTIITAEAWDCPQIISDGAVINITGRPSFLFSKNIDLENFTINTDDGGGSGIDSAYRPNMFRPKNATIQIEWASIKNLQINGLVASDKRAIAGLDIPPCSKWINIENIVSENIASLIWCSGLSKNISIKNIAGKNTETLVNLQEIENAFVDNLGIVNTKAQSKWWVGKNVGVGTNGKDTLLVEKGRGIKMNNIRGEWCIERPIYCQASDVFADNLESINTGCCKFVGGLFDGNFQVDNIYVGKTVIRRNDTGILDNIGQIYGCKDIYIDNLKIIFDRSLVDITADLFRIEGNNGKIIINNIECYNGNSSLFVYNGGVTKELTINNAYYKANGTYDGAGMLIGKNIVHVINPDLEYIEKLVVGKFVGETISTARFRNIINNPVANKLFLSAEIGEIFVDGIRPGSAVQIFGVDDFLNTSAKKIETKFVNIPVYFQGASLLANGLFSTKRVNLKLITSGGVNDIYEVDIVKEDTLNKDITKYIKQVRLKAISSDLQFDFPVSTSYMWDIEVKSSVGGYAQYRLIGGVLTEVYNSGTNIIIKTGEFAAGSKLSIWVENGRLVGRTRNVGDAFEIIAKNKSISA